MIATHTLQPGGHGYRMAVIGMRLVLVSLLLLGWQFGHQLLGTVYIAAPLDVAQRIVQIAANGQLWPHVGATLLASSVGFAIGWVLGFAAAVLLNFSPRAALAFEPYVMLAMGVPLFALIPLLILWFGIGITPKVVIVVSLVFFIVFISTISGLRSIDRKLLDMARVMGASRGQIIAKVSRHAILPHVFSGLKIGVPRAISAAIVGEFLVADRGLGYYIEQSRQTVDPVGVFAGIVLVTLLVMLSDIVLGWLQRRAFRWQHATTLF